MRTLVVIATLALAIACVPRLDEDPSVVRRERVLAVRVDPPEAAPGASVVLTALDVDPAGPADGSGLDWAACTARLPLAEPGPVARACVRGDADAIAPLTSAGTSATLTLSADACRLYGPDPPPATAGQPSGRPVDPDATGGYAQPIRIALADGSIALASVRLTCGVAGATRAQAAELRRRYHPNTHPTLSAVSAVFEDGSFQDVVDGVPLQVQAGARVVLHAGWPTCPTSDACGDGVCGADEDRTSCAGDCVTPTGCAGAERFARFDPEAGAVVAQRESIVISWSTTIGHFLAPRTGRAGTDTATEAEGTFVAPAEPGSGWIWLVIRDDRGGVSSQATRIVVAAP